VSRGCQANESAGAVCYIGRVSIEKVFAIEASPAVIWEALWNELSLGEPGAFSLQGSSWPSVLTLRVDLGGMPCELIYRIEPKTDYCEVSATLIPLSKRYGFYQVVTFGHLKRNYETLLVMGLANLKQAVEGGQAGDRTA
jgi:hypothetical protein